MQTPSGKSSSGRHKTVRRRRGTTDISQTLVQRAQITVVLWVLCFSPCRCGTLPTLEDIHAHRETALPAWSGFAQSGAPLPPSVNCIASGVWRFELLPQLGLEASWQSALPRAETDITIVTQLSLSRLELLPLMCETWRGVIAAAVFVPVLSGKVVLPGGGDSMLLAEAQQQLAEVHRQAEDAGKCKLDMALYYEEVPNEGAALEYPINALRNRALLMAQTEVVALLDIDFLVSAGLSDPSAYPDILAATRGRSAVVIPAFSTVASSSLGVWSVRELKPQDVDFQEDDAHQAEDGDERLQEDRQLARSAVQGDKATVLELLGRGKLQAMRAGGSAHRATDYERWKSSDETYTVKHEEMYEPYILASREAVPLYDERFRGYYLNKVLQLHHMASQGFKWQVHPAAFLVHYPHLTSGAAKHMTLSGKRKQLVEWKNTALEDMEAGEYTPVSIFTCTFPQDLNPWGAPITPEEPDVADAASRRRRGSTGEENGRSRITEVESLALPGTPAGSNSEGSAGGRNDASGRESKDGDVQEPGVQGMHQNRRPHHVRPHNERSRRFLLSRF